MATAAFIGLGVMGFPMAGHLVDKGHDVTVWNRSPAKAAAWTRTHKGRAALSPGEAATGRELVFVCVGADTDVRAVAYPALEAMDKGAVLVDHTTASPALARELAAAAAATGVGFVDAPVSGGQAGAEKGQLTIMCGGRAEDLARAEPVMTAYAKAITHMGEAGAGQLTKAVNQIAIAGLLQGLAEAVHFAKRTGLDPDLVLKAIGKGAAQSWQMDNRMTTMAQGKFDFGFAVDWMRKDLAIALDEARRAGARLPVAALVDQFYAEVQAMGGSRWDTSSLAARLEAAEQLDRNEKP
jgi:3-hydroxyisobutyrate dehydrogenase-like beta-hydroxyacid dehydrogenase